MEWDTSGLASDFGREWCFIVNDDDIWPVLLFGLAGGVRGRKEMRGAFSDKSLCIFGIEFVG